MQVELRSIDDMRPYEQNPRQNDQAIEAVAASLREFGFRQPIVVDEAGVIIVGHTRWKAAKQLGLTKVPVHVARDLSPEKARAYRIADNQTNELAEWDLELLPIELEGLEADGIDLSHLGFDPDELARLLSPVEEVEAPVLPTGDKAPIETMSFSLSSDQAETVREALQRAKDAKPLPDSGNINGTALTRIAEAYLVQR
ncbi:MAG: ParB N-terminal domain-containing protein [Planctomycetes bacterium]|nr:ParB N-terminal domain-containing protein [Planctomycetota bacterium]